jgi:uncharacterized protein YjiS (DUF1127 family)
LIQIRPQSGPTLLAAARTQIGRAIRTINFWIDRSRQRRALDDIAALDGHLLRDIGVPRAAAQREAAKLFWR